MVKDLHKIWGHQWLNPKVRVTKSPVFGYAPFAVKDIAKHEIIRITGGIVIPKKDIKKYERLMGFAAEIQITEDFFLGPAKAEERKVRGMFNHSCDPNVGFLDSITIIAIRKIKAGEELVMDYATFGGAFDTFNCNCGSENCRKTITENDWKLPELQAKYGKYFSPYLKRRFV